MKLDLNLKDLGGDPTDTQIGAAAVGLMAQAVSLEFISLSSNCLFQVKAKGPEETQVNALTGFSNQIMSKYQWWVQLFFGVRQ